MLKTTFPFYSSSLKPFDTDNFRKGSVPSTELTLMLDCTPEARGIMITSVNVIAVTSLFLQWEITVPRIP